MMRTVIQETCAEFHFFEQDFFQTPMFFQIHADELGHK